jgi:hypothetical protein
MSNIRHVPEAGVPGSVSAPPADLQTFPDCCRVDPLRPFSRRWSAKREDHDRFVRAIETANRNLPAGWRLPDELAADWLAQWANDLFIGGIPQHDRLSREEVVAAIGDVAALVEGLRFVDRYGGLLRTQRFWFYELADEPGVCGFPTVDWVRRHQPDLDPRRGVEGSAGDAAIRPRCDQRQFFERASFLLSAPSPEQGGWLRRLAYRPDPLQPLWADPPRHYVWARSQLQRVIPELAGLLSIGYPQIEDDVHVPELIRRVHNWVVEQARPKRGDSVKVNEPGPSDTEPSGTGKRPKKSTERGDGRVKIIAALTAHHRFAADGVLNLEPINNNELARRAGVSPSTASAFFNKEFQGHGKYKALCKDASGLTGVLKLLNGDYSPHHLYGRRPVGENDRDDEG